MNGLKHYIGVEDQNDVDNNNTKESLGQRDEVQPAEKDRIPVIHDKNKTSLSLIIDDLYTPNSPVQNKAVEATNQDEIQKTHHEDIATPYINLVLDKPDLEETTSNQNQVSSTPTIRLDYYTLDMEENESSRQESKVKDTELVETQRSLRKDNAKFLPKRRVTFDLSENCEEVVSLEIEENISPRPKNKIKHTGLVEIPSTHSKYNVKFVSKRSTDFDLSKNCEEIFINRETVKDFFKVLTYFIYLTIAIIVLIIIIPLL